MGGRRGDFNTPLLGLPGLHAGPCPMFTQLCMSLSLSLLASGHPAGVGMHTLLWGTSLCGRQFLPVSVTLPRGLRSLTLYINSHWAAESATSVSYHSFSLESGFGAGGILEGPAPISGLSEVSGNGTYCQAKTSPRRGPWGALWRSSL